MSSPGERLSTLAEMVGASMVGGSTADPLIRDVTHDSRQAGPGTLFVAIPGANHDGHEFVDAAVAAGAPAVCVERASEVEVPQLVMGDTRRALGTLAAAVQGHPSREVALIGITGTNGKTTVTWMLESIATVAGMTPGLIGTVHTRVAGDVVPTLRTTPEASDFQRLLRVMADRGARLVAAEVSSHALALGRVDGATFAVAGFTNLSQDHLDFHGTMEAYFEAKASLFEEGRSRQAVVFVDDPAGRRLAERISIPVTTVAAQAPADLTGEVVEADLTGTTIRLRLDRDRTLRLPLPGSFNLANALVAAGCARAAGIDPDAIVAGLEATPPIPGRFEVVSGESPLIAVVDYAHTPVGIEGAVAAARQLGARRVIAVLGAGGDRDRSKRPAMGAAAATADLAVITSDNPRWEDPETIIDEVMSGVPDAAAVRRVPDRRQAIIAALEAAEPGDAVLVLGKGHERGQEVAGVVHPFDDRAVVRAELARVAGEDR